MGKGDKKSKKGKIAKGSYGNSRRKKKKVSVLPKATAEKAVSAAAGEEKAKRSTRKKADA